MVSKEPLALWEARYILEGMPLPEDKTFSIGVFCFERPSGKEFEHLWLPALARVEVEARENEDIAGLGRRLLRDFLGLYVLEVNYAIRIVRDDGYANKTPTTKLKAIYPITLYGGEEKPPKFFNERLNLASKTFKAIDFSRKQNAYLRTAIDYLLYSGESSRKEEKLINLVISLETLFSIDSQELSYGIAHRAASLLGESREQRTQIFKDIREIYKERSQIVHRGYSKYANGKTWEHVRKASEYARDSIKKFLSLASIY